MKVSSSKHPFCKFSGKLMSNRVNTEGNQSAVHKQNKPLTKLMAGRRVNTENEPEQIKSANRKYLLKKANSKLGQKEQRLTYTKQNTGSNKLRQQFENRASYNQYGWKGSLNITQKLKKYRIKQEQPHNFQKNHSNIEEQNKLKQVCAENRKNFFHSHNNDRKLREASGYEEEEKYLKHKGGNMHDKVSKKIKEEIIDKDRKKLMIFSHKYQKNEKKNEEEDYRELLKNKKNLKISDFNFVKLIGAGTFGKVYNAIYQDSQVKVAIKKVFNDKNYKNREIELMRIVNSPFVIRQLADFVTHELDDEEGKQQIKEYYHFVMPTYSCNLYEYLQNTKSSGKLCNLDIKIILYQMFRGLLYLHSRGICHRDLKPQNILINQSKNLVLCDLGSAKILNKGQSNIAYICSRCYRAPQLIFGNTEYTVSIDLWSAGCIILEILNGYPLFIGKDSLQHLVEIIKVMGTPTKQQIALMNPQYDARKFSVPKIPKKHWSQIFPRIQNGLIALLNSIMTYSPSSRLNSAQIITHAYFNELRQQSIFRSISKTTDTRNFFNFDHYELKYAKNDEKLIPKWYRSH